MQQAVYSKNTKLCIGTSQKIPCSTLLYHLQVFSVYNEWNSYLMTYGSIYPFFSWETYWYISLLKINLYFGNCPLFSRQYRTFICLATGIRVLRGIVACCTLYFLFVTRFVAFRWTAPDQSIWPCSSGCIPLPDSNALIQFQPMFHFYTPWIHVFKGYRSEMLVKNGLNLNRITLQYAFQTYWWGNSRQEPRSCKWSNSTIGKPELSS